MKVLNWLMIAFMVIIILCSINIVLGIDSTNILHAYFYDNCSTKDLGINQRNLTSIGTLFDYPLVMNSGCLFTGTQYFYTNNFNDTDIKTIEIWLLKSNSNTNSFYCDYTQWTNISNCYYSDGTPQLYTYSYYDSIYINYDFYTIPVNLNEKYLLTIVYDGTYAKRYINGVYYDEAVYSGNEPTSNTNTLHLGSDYNYIDRWYGILSRITMFNITLTPEQVLEGYNNGTGKNWLTPHLSLNNITSCGTYNLYNNFYELNLASINASPCLELSMENATLSCSENIIGSGGVLAYIKYMNDSIIENCAFDNFLQGFLIPYGYYDATYSENNIFRNISEKNFDSSMFGFYVMTELGQVMNHTEIYNNYAENSYSNSAYTLYGNGMDYMNIHDNYINGSYSGIVEYYLPNNILSNNKIIGGTIYGITLFGMDDTVLINNDIENFAICSMALNGCNNVTLINNLNDYDNLGMYIPQFCIVEYPSTINESSSYNLGWFPKDYHSTLIYNINETSYYNLTNSQDIYYDDNLSIYYMVHNASKSYFIFPECHEIWVKEANACINAVSIITYHDANRCDSYHDLPTDNSTNEYCLFTPTNFLSQFTFLDFIFLFIIGLTIWFPFFMNDKRYTSTFILSGLLLVVYSIYLKHKLVTLYPDNTAMIYILQYLLFTVCALLCIYGIFGLIHLMFPGQKKT